MVNDNNRLLAANYIGAIAHAFSGRPDRHDEFVDKVDVLLSPREADAMSLLRHVDTVRSSGRPLLWIHLSPDLPNVPQIGLVAQAGHQVCAMELCLLWRPASGGRMTLIPDSFKYGSFRFDDGLRLKHTWRTPATNFEAAAPGMARAYAALREIEAEQLRQGVRFKLPSLVRHRAA